MNKQENDFAITPETRVGALLDKYPQLEEVLMEMAPAFNKLRNPILRKTIAKVATLRQIAQVGDISLMTMINKLRSAIGNHDEVSFEEVEMVNSTNPPTWFEQTSIVTSLDARPLLEAGEQPVNQVMKDLKKLIHGQIYELITPFLPEPLINMAKSKGFQVWSKKEGDEVIKTYFSP